MTSRSVRHVDAALVHLIVDESELAIDNLVEVSVRNTPSVLHCLLLLLLLRLPAFRRFRVGDRCAVRLRRGRRRWDESGRICCRRVVVIGTVVVGDRLDLSVVNVIKLLFRLASLFLLPPLSIQLPVELLPLLLESALERLARLISRRSVLLSASRK